MKDKFIMEISLISLCQVVLKNEFILKALNTQAGIAKVVSFY